MGMEVNTVDVVMESNEKVPYVTADLTKTPDGKYTCLSCSHVAKASSSMVSHISTHHPEFLHTPRRRRCKSEKTENSRGINTWTKEELADPTKKLYYATSNLERENGQYKCFCCSYTTPSAGAIAPHISYNHPQFVHMSQKRRLPSVACGIMSWTEEELNDPNKVLYFTTTNFEKQDGRYKCFSCPYSSPQATSVVIHISRKHPKFVYKPKAPKFTEGNVGRGIRTWSEEDVADPNKILYFTTTNFEKIGDKYKCFCCDYNSPQAALVTRHIKSQHPRFVHQNLRKKTTDTHLKKDSPGAKIWSKEELADESIQLFYTTSDLTKSDGKFDCMCCSYQSVHSSSVTTHVAAHHPRFIHQPIHKNRVNYEVVKQESSELEVLKEDETPPAIECSIFAALIKEAEVNLGDLPDSKIITKATRKRKMDAPQATPIARSRRRNIKDVSEQQNEEQSSEKSPVSLPEILETFSVHKQAIKCEIQDEEIFLSNTPIPKLETPLCNNKSKELLGSQTDKKTAVIVPTPAPKKRSRRNRYVSKSSPETSITNMTFFESKLTNSSQEETSVEPEPTNVDPVVAMNMCISEPTFDSYFLMLVGMDVISSHDVIEEVPDVKIEPDYEEKFVPGDFNLDIDFFDDCHDDVVLFGAESEQTGTALRYDCASILLKGHLNANFEQTSLVNMKDVNKSKVTSFDNQLLDHIKSDELAETVPTNFQKKMNKYNRLLHKLKDYLNVFIVGQDTSSREMQRIKEHFACIIQPVNDISCPKIPIPAKNGRDHTKQFRLETTMERELMKSFAEVSILRKMFEHLEKIKTEIEELCKWRII